MKINRLPKDDRTNGWSGVLSPRQATPALQGEVVADWLVLGAGYAGLAAVRRLAELHPEQSIALIDAGEAGENASGRNSGFAIDLPHNVGSSLEELEGELLAELAAGCNVLIKGSRFMGLDRLVRQIEALEAANGVGV